MCLFVCLFVCTGTFHLIHMLMDDYLLHLLEAILEKQQQREFEQKILILRDGMYNIIPTVQYYTVEDLNNGDCGDEQFVHCLKVVSSWEVEMYGQLMAGDKHFVLLVECVQYRIFLHTQSLLLCVLLTCVSLINSFLEKDVVLSDMHTSQRVDNQPHPTLSLVESTLQQPQQQQNTPAAGGGLFNAPLPLHSMYECMLT